MPMQHRKRMPGTRGLVLAAVVAAAAGGLALAALPAGAAPVSDHEYGQVTVDLHTVPRSLGSLQADGNPCQKLDWLIIGNDDYIGLPGNDGKALRTTSGKQLTFRGYPSADCSGPPASTFVHTFGEPNSTWANGSLYEIAWQAG
jgi:hypothetical protein